ncbi:MAG: hypothetical protein EA367_09910 [Leptolyngbya sp. DLM2.Bin15]|nr:MAG: hypothetical protein EA367_09910 [Leptolyngbya sp. DLM2.Bin15]
MEELFLEYKDHINVSQAALKCVKAELDQAKQVAEGFISTDAMIQRLRMERLQEEDQAFQLGYSQGVEDFKNKSYGSIQSIMEAYLRGYAEGIMDTYDDEDDIKGLFKQLAIHLEVSSHQLAHLALGYGKATKDCWEKIEAQVMA